MVLTIFFASMFPNVPPVITFSDPSEARIKTLNPCSASAAIIGNVFIKFMISEKIEAPLVEVNQANVSLVVLNK